MPTLLTADLVAETLTALPGWTGDATALVRDLHLSAELDVELRRQVDVDAHAMGHLPTVEDIPDGTRFRLTTEAVGGVTELDIALASHISDLAHRLSAGEPAINAVRHDDVEAESGAVDAPKQTEVVNQRVL